MEVPYSRNFNLSKVCNINNFCRGVEGRTIDKMIRLDFKVPRGTAPSIVGFGYGGFTPYLRHKLRSENDSVINCHLITELLRGEFNLELCSGLPNTPSHASAFLLVSSSLF